MAFDTVSDIKEVIAEKEEEKRDLVKRMDEDWDLLVLEPYASDQGKGNENYTSSAPRNIFDQVLDGVNQAVITLQIQLPEKATKKAREAASKGELYLHGALNAIDRRLKNIDEPPLREGLAHFICSRGWYAMRALVYVPKGKQDTVFDVLPWDPMHLTWDHDADGLIWTGYKRWRTKARILSEYNVTVTGSGAMVTDFWDRDRNSVIIDEGFGKDPTDHTIEHVPVLIGSVGSMPTIQRNMDGSVTGSERSANNSFVTSTLEHRGDSVWAASRHLYLPQNRYVSYVFDTAKRAVAGSIVVETDDGKEVTWAGDPYESYQAIPTKPGQKIYPLELPKAPPETAAVLEIINNDIQRSTLPNPDFPDRAESGRALAIRLEATRKVYEPRTEALSRCYEWLAEELLSQYSTKGIKAVNLHGYQGDGTFFQVTTKPTDIDENWIVKAPVEPRLPRDEDAEMNLAIAATRRSSDQEAMVSMHYARERIIKLDDPDAEHTKVLAEEGENFPPVKIAQVADALKQRGEPELAEAFLLAMTGGGEGIAPAGPAGPPVGPTVGALPPELLEAVVGVLAQVEPQLAEMFVVALQGGAPTGPPVNGAAPGPQQTVPGVQLPNIASVFQG